MLSKAEHNVLEEAAELLLSWLDAPKARIRFEERPPDAHLVVEHGRLRVVVEYKGSANSAVVDLAIRRIKASARHLGPRVVTVIAVPYMGDTGKRLCAEAGVSWLDLSGNASISAPGLRVIIEGKTNRFTRRGRPSTAFAPKSSRIARRLLIEPRRAFKQQELARLTGLDDGFTSRIVHRLETDGLVQREKKGAVRVDDAGRLLDSWSEVYDFKKHLIVPGHVTTPSGEDLLPRLHKGLSKGKVRYAATGLAAAWLHTRFVGFRLVTLFVEEQPRESLLKEIGFRQEPRGANVWLVVPNDDGVFDGSSEKDGIECVHPVQVYVDLPAHPERAQEAAAELRAQLFRGGRQWS